MPKPTLIVFGEDWGSHPSSTQHLMPFITEDFNVVWVNSIGLRRPQFNRRDLRRVFNKVLAKFRPHSGSKNTQISPFPVIAPWLIPLPSSSIGKLMNRWLLRLQLKGRLAASDDIWVWTSLPSAVDFVGALDERGWFYYCGDDFAALAGVDHMSVKPREALLDEVAKVVWVASAHLSKRFSNVNTRLLEHGVDWPLFASTIETPVPVSETMPVLGFYGALADWIDQDLISGIAKALPNWKIVLIGPVVTEITTLKLLENVELLGPLPHDQLPRYVQGWTAAILPFKDNDQIRACNPLKLREYLASGTPILSTPFPALEPYLTHVRVVHCVTDAVCSLQDVHHCPDSNSIRLARQQSVATESWQARALTVKKDMARYCQA